MDPKRSKIDIAQLLRYSRSASIVRNLLEEIIRVIHRGGVKDISPADLGPDKGLDLVGLEVELSKLEEEKKGKDSPKKNDSNKE